MGYIAILYHPIANNFYIHGYCFISVLYKTHFCIFSQRNTCYFSPIRLFSGAGLLIISICPNEADITISNVSPTANNSVSPDNIITNTS